MAEETLPRFPAKALTLAANAFLRSVGAPAHTLLPDEVELPPTEVTERLAGHALAAGYFVERVEFFEDDVPLLIDAGRPFIFMPLPALDSIHVATAVSKKELTFVDLRGVETTIDRKTAERALRATRARGLEQLARRIDPAADRSERIVRGLAAELGSSMPVGVGYVLRKNEVGSVGEAVDSLGLGRQGAKLLGMSALQSALTTAAWAVLGSVAIAGHAETSNLLGWALLSATATLLQVVSMRIVGAFTVRSATTLRARLLEGALGLDPDSLGEYGLGGLMVIATQADSFTGSIVSLFVAILGVLTNLVATGAVLSISPVPAVMIALFSAFALAIVACAPRIAKHQDTLQRERMRTTTDMVERMLGHRTRLVQQTPNTWHEGEDESLLRYAQAGKQLDRLTFILHAAPRTFYLASIVVLFTVLVSKPTQMALALSVGGMTLGMATLDALVNVVLAGGNLYALFRAIRPMVHDRQQGARSSAIRPDLEGDKKRPIIELRGVRYGYPNRSKKVLDDVGLEIGHEERVLIEGPSGGGKTTLASVISGLRKPDAGLVFVAGLDQHTMPEGELRSVIATAPQFYKNHIFTESLAFNLLLGRSWPPEQADLAEAAHVAVALGLGPLLDRMPSGLFQQVGETGWQLSHGEKSRVYLARALLQRSKVLVLDETFGALDPASLRQSMDFVLDAPKSIVVITHR
jgi:ATP-binding cassette subfamily B protein